MNHDERLTGCQIPCLPRVADGIIQFDAKPPLTMFKRIFARPWNYSIKGKLRNTVRTFSSWKSRFFHSDTAKKGYLDNLLKVDLQAGDWVRVRSREEIQATLDTWKELKGCAFLDYMWQYCGTTQRILQPIRRFLDERDYKVKKSKGIVLLEGVICKGTPVCGQCDRCCHLFWREEWLEKIDKPTDIV